MLCIFDFDKTLVDEDTDATVLKALDAFVIARKHYGAHRSWTDAVDAGMEAAHARGRTCAEVVAALAPLSLGRDRIDALRAAVDAGCELNIVSDANTIFIDAVLAADGVRGLFDGIHTNRAAYDEAGRLRVRPFHEGPPHACPRGCPPNLCKGEVVGALLARRPDATAVLYVGDAANDVCGALRACRNGRGVVLARAGHPLHASMAEAWGQTDARLVTWHDGATQAAGLRAALGLSPIPAAPPPPPEDDYFMPGLFIPTGYLPREFCFGGEPPLILTALCLPAAVTDHDLTGQIDWPGAWLLGAWIAAQPVGFWAGTRTLELGAGLGLPSLAVASRGGRALATDGSGPVMDVLERNCRSLGCGEAAAAPLVWGDVSEEAAVLTRLGARPPEYILAADVCYPGTQAALPDLFATARRLLRPGMGVTCTCGAPAQIGVAGWATGDAGPGVTGHPALMLAYVSRSVGTDRAVSEAAHAAGWGAAEVHGTRNVALGGGLTGCLYRLELRQCCRGGACAR